MFKIIRYKSDQFEYKTKWVDLYSRADINSCHPLLISGAEGSGKYSRVLYLIHKYYNLTEPLIIYNADIRFTDDNCKMFTINVNKSRYHTEVDFIKYLHMDRDIVEYYIDECLMARTKFSNGKKILILRNVDVISISSQFILSKLIEKHQDNVMFFIITNKIDKIKHYLKNKLTIIYNKSPNRSDLLAIYSKYIESRYKYNNDQKKEYFDILYNKLKLIYGSLIPLTDFNYLLKICLKKDKFVEHIFEYEKWFDYLINKIEKPNLTITDTLGCRNAWYDIYTKIIPFNQVITYFYNLVNIVFPVSKRMQLLQIFANLDTSDPCGREIYYYENLFWKCYNLYHYDQIM